MNTRFLPLDVTERRFASIHVLAAAELDRHTLRNWLTREPQVVFMTDEERRDVGERQRFAYSFNRVMQIALTAHLVRLGLQARRAALSAAVFTDMGTEERLPGQLFLPPHSTYLVIAGTSENDDPVAITRVLAGGEFIAHLDLLAAKGNAAAIIVNLTLIFWSVCGALGLRIGHDEQGREIPEYPEPATVKGGAVA